MNCSYVMRQIHIYLYEQKAKHLKWKNILSLDRLPPQNYLQKQMKTRMWANAQRDGRPAEHRWCPLFNAAKFG